MLARLAALLMLGLLPCAAPAQPDKIQPPPGKDDKAAAPDLPEPSFVLSYLVAILLSVGVLLVVCMPSRKG